MKHYVGLDVSMKETFICIMNENGKVIDQGRAKTKARLQYVPEKTKADFAVTKFWLQSRLCNPHISRWCCCLLKNVLTEIIFPSIVRSL